MTNHNPLPSQGFLRLPAVLKIFPVGRSTWWAGVKSGRFPKPVKLGPKTTAWRVEDIRALVDNPLATSKPRSFVERVQSQSTDGGNAAMISRHNQLSR